LAGFGDHWWGTGPTEFDAQPSPARQLGEGPREREFTLLRKPKDGGEVRFYEPIMDGKLFTDADRVLTANPDGTIAVWRVFQLLTKSEETNITEKSTTNSIRSDFYTSGLLQVDGRSVETVTFRRKMVVLPAPGVWKVIISPDQGTVCTLHEGGVVRVWDGRLRTGNPLLP
jgi:WD40 repeat protein